MVQHLNVRRKLAVACISLLYGTVFNAAGKSLFVFGPEQKWRLKRI